MVDQVMDRSKTNGKWDEVGSIGLSAFSGYITEAYNRELFWPGVESLYTKMWRSDPEVGIARLVFESLASKLRVEFVQPAEVEKPTDDDRMALEFANQVLDDVEGGIDQWLVSAMTRLPFFGWGWWEVVPGLRKDGWRPPQNDPWRSEYDDGMIGYRRLAFRQYSSFFGWDMDDSTGRVNGFIQNDPPNDLVTIPTGRSLHLRFGDITNPEGLATLESLWRLERIKYSLEVIQTIGMEHAAGFAKFSTGDELTGEDKAYIKKVARALLSAKEGNYLVLPEHIEAEIMDTPFQAAPAILDAIRYYGILKMAMFHMQWAALGVLSPYGSYSTIKDANQFFLTLFNSMVTGFATQADEQIGKRLFEFPVNKERFPQMTKRPRLSISKAEKIVDLDELGSFMTAANAVLPLGDDDMIALRRKSEILPEALPEDVVNKDEPEEESEEGTSAEESLDSDGEPAEDMENVSDDGVNPDEEESEMSAFPAWVELQQALQFNDGVMIAFKVPRDVASSIAVDWEGAIAPEDMHLTLAFLGNVDDIAADREALISVVKSFAEWMPPIVGKVSGIGTFFETAGDGNNATYASFDSPNLPGFRQRLVDELRASNISVKRNHGFTPHITLAYSDAFPPEGFNIPKDYEVKFDRLMLSIGDEEIFFPLVGRPAVLAARKFRVAADEFPMYPDASEGYPSEQDIRRSLRSFQRWAKENDPVMAKLLGADELDDDEDESESLSEPIRMGDVWPLQFGEVVDLLTEWKEKIEYWDRRKRPIRDPRTIVRYHLSGYKREIVKKIKYKIGYEVWTEKVDLENGDAPVIIQSAYTPDGVYIGDPRVARYLIKERGIVPELAAPDKEVCTVGYCEDDGQWYGWSHRAICGFAIGDRIFDPEYGDENTPFKEHGSQTIRSKVQQRKAAVAFAEYVS